MPEALDICPACGQPKGRGYGCAVLLPERNYRWIADDEFSQSCSGCLQTDATHYHKPQDAHSVDSGAAKALTGTTRHCVACGGTAGAHLAPADACPDCARYLAAIERQAGELAASRALLASPVQRYGPSLEGRSAVVIDGAFWDAALKARR